MTIVDADLHEHRDPWDDARRALRAADERVGLMPEHEVEFWIHAHPHCPGHEELLWGDHKRALDGEMIA